jgi:ABC-type Fe3+/spermidine/putrescine transport system ATPase subunit
LRLIAGLDYPNAGQVFLSGKEVTDEPANRRAVHTVFQSYALFPRKSVAENVAYGLRAAGVPAAQRRRRVSDMVSLVGLTGKEQRRPDQLSGGEQQRVPLARALVNEPPVLLLDEPLAALDAQLRNEMQIELRRLQRETGCTFVLVTHDQDEALSLCDRVGVMFAGMIEQVATPAELSRRPVSRSIAEFIGRSSVLPAQWSDGKAVVGPSWSLTADSDAQLSNGAPCHLIVRPRQLRLTADEGMPGRITRISFTGDRHEATVNTGAGDIRVEIDNLCHTVGDDVRVTGDGTLGWAVPACGPDEEWSKGD